MVISLYHTHKFLVSANIHNWTAPPTCTTIAACSNDIINNIANIPATTESAKANECPTWTAAQARTSTGFCLDWFVCGTSGWTGHCTNVCLLEFMTSINVVIFRRKESPPPEDPNLARGAGERRSLTLRPVQPPPQPPAHKSGKDVSHLYFVLFMIESFRTNKIIAMLWRQKKHGK